MNIWLFIGSLLFSGSHIIGSALAEPTDLLVNSATQTLALMKNCRSETSPLLRLECYDNTLASTQGAVINHINAGPSWQRAMEQEQQRTDHSTTFLVTEGTAESNMVILTAPAIGIPPPRPVLMISCIDNITRLQVALIRPQKRGEVTLITDQDRFEAHWFLRENGYLLESSRGLPGIDEIKRLMSANTLTINGLTGGTPRLTFNISQLTQALKPLRNACRW